ncbi:unnamed protein product [Dibothriocephalus latus]|uniref:Uncharacterized protein n=1 Tax=Dibothriocephalus latus TaxID=60516 RepID=A0A3P7P6D9_DIBLA|nr:unnamed protein product [Dibothriocephalus latus]
MLVTREHYQIIRQVSVKTSIYCNWVRNVNGSFIDENSAKVDRWREHFDHLLNFDEQPIKPFPSSAAEFQASPGNTVV